MPQGFQAEWPFVGRRALVRRVIEAIEGTTFGGVLLIGDPGVGKTRIATEALSVAASRGYATDWTAASGTAATIPFGALSALLPLTSVAELGAPNRLGELEALRRAVHGRAEDQPLVVAIDDAHLLDPASATLVHQLALGRRVPVVLTARRGVPLPDALHAAWKDEAIARIEVEALPVGQVGPLLTQALGAPLDSTTERELARLSDGNVLFLRELVRSALESDALVLDGGRWRLRSMPATGTRLADLIEHRIAASPSRARDVVEVLAVAGTVALAVLESVVDDDALDDAEHHELVVVERSGRRRMARVAHPLYGELALQRMSPRRARRICRSLLEALADTPRRRRDDVVRSVAWALDAGDAVTPGLHVHAARQAIESGDAVQAERFARAATSEGRRDVDAIVALADALARQGRAKEALTALSTLDDHFQHHRRVVAFRVSILYYALGLRDEAMADVDEALRTATLPADQGYLCAVRSRLLLAEGHVADALAQLRGIGDDGLDQLAIDERTRSLAAALVIAGYFAEAEQVAVDALQHPVAATNEVEPSLPWPMATLMTVAVLRGHIHPALVLVRSAHETARQMGHPVMEAMSSAFLGGLEFLTGDIAASVDHCEHALASIPDFDPEGLELVALLAGVPALLLSGDHDRAREMLARYDRERTTIPLYEPLVMATRAGLLLADGMSREADDLLADALDRSVAQGAWSIALQVGAMAAAGTRPRRALDQLLLIQERIDGDEIELAVRRAKLGVDENAQGMSTLAGDLEKRGLLTSACNTLVHASELYRRKGALGSALTARERAEAIAARCPGMQLRQPDPAAHALTRREHEIGLLAADGLTNQEIADKLGISVRTVDTHLARVFTKLGVSRRQELPALLG